MKSNAVLPQEEVDELRRLRELEDPTELRARVVALRAAKWPLRAIGDPLGITRVGVRSWWMIAKENPAVMERAEELKDAIPRVPLTARGSGVKSRRIYPQVPERDIPRLQELAKQVRTIRGATPPDSPARKAAVEYVALLDMYVNKRKVPAQHVARAAGVTRRAIVARLEKLEKADA